MKQSRPVGSIISADLTVPHAEKVRDFYKEVVGWTVESMAMEDETGKYEDYVMKDASGNWAGGVCHKRGMNDDLPAQWIVYVNVADIATSLEKCKAQGGAVVKEVKGENGEYFYALIKDPAGALLALVKS